jgi:hypothetical protein
MTLLETSEPHPDPQAITSNSGHSSTTGVDYKPHPSKLLVKTSLTTKREDRGFMCRLCSGSASDEDRQVFAEKAIYNDPELLRYQI